MQGCTATMFFIHILAWEYNVYSRSHSNYFVSFFFRWVKHIIWCPLYVINFSSCLSVIHPPPPPPKKERFAILVINRDVSRPPYQCLYR
jgi:hypothetical protein